MAPTEERAMIYSGEAMAASERLGTYAAGARVRHRKHGFGKIIRRISPGRFDVRFECGPRFVELGEIALAGHLRAVVSGNTPPFFPPK